MTALFLAPHHDDETLFGAFTLLRHKPTVLVCLEGDERRVSETNAAMEILGCPCETSGVAEEATRLGHPDNSLALLYPERVFAPKPSAGGNGDHNRVGELAASFWPGQVTFYTTYTVDGKQTGSTLVPYAPEWIGLKLRALACYESQFEQPGRATHFLRDQLEFYA